MSAISLQYAKEAGAFLVTTALSCGPSQLFGAIKLIVDTYLIFVKYHRKSKINHSIKEIDNSWDEFKKAQQQVLWQKSWV